MCLPSVARKYRNHKKIYRQSYRYRHQLFYYRLCHFYKWLATSIVLQGWISSCFIYVLHKLTTMLTDVNVFAKKNFFLKFVTFCLFNENLRKHRNRLRKAIIITNSLVYIFKFLAFCIPRIYIHGRSFDDKLTYSMIYWGK